MRIPASRYHRHRFPAEIISHCVWLYFRFALSFRDIEEMLAMRGVVLTYETVREWCLKFGQTYANDLRRRSPRPGDRWHLDEVFLKINGRIHYLWRAVDQDGDVLDILVQNKRDKKAAKKFFRKLLKGLRYVPRVIITDKLRSYSAAKDALLPSVEHHQRHCQLNFLKRLDHQLRPARALWSSVDWRSLPNEHRSQLQLPFPRGRILISSLRGIRKLGTSVVLLGSVTQ